MKEYTVQACVLQTLEVYEFSVKAKTIIEAIKHVSRLMDCKDIENYNFEIISAFEKRKKYILTKCLIEV